MANSKQSRKRARQATKRQARNQSARSMLRTFIKKVVSAIEAKDVDLANNNFRIAASIIDKAVSKGLIHKNKAARVKSRLNKKIKVLSQA